MNGQETDCLEIEYGAGDKLFVPVNQLHLVARWSAEEGSRPAVHRLGSSSWAKTKAKAKAAIQEMAGELLRTYALRKAMPGHAYRGRPVWQRELEAAFIYEETPHQLRAIAEVKADMEAPRPMDRLVCGDVGYGKTEVAIRAAFKAVMDHRQVAVLVPTTILAQQHFDTFRERLADFPVRLELLSRFRSPKQIKEAVAKLAAGEVDILIGTHRLLSKDVQFKDLGLIIIDEEQRFGVAHKERLRKMLRAGRRADADRDADPAHAQLLAGRRARHVADRDRAARPPARAHRDRRVRARTCATRDARARPRRPGVLRPQSRRVDHHRAAMLERLVPRCASAWRTGRCASTSSSA